MRAHRRIAAWLLVCCALVFAIVVVGGVTRLTHSGLSITEWQPIVGTLPPLSDADWSAAFAKYQLTPEYQQVNKGMTLAEFQRIFWWEYLHRLLGRLVGVVFLVPFLWFLARRQIPPGYWAGRFAGIFALGAAQGALGWYMVQERAGRRSARVAVPPDGASGACVPDLRGDVLGGVVAARRRVSADRANADVAATRRWAAAVACLVFVQVLSGGMVAGIRAGFAYNTFPLMNGALVPPEILSLDPWWKNFFYNMATVQFDHRLLALVARRSPCRCCGGEIARMPRRIARVRVGAHLAAGDAGRAGDAGHPDAGLVVPVPLAALHQAGALLLSRLR